jgi:antitoxin HicB
VKSLNAKFLITMTHHIFNYKIVLMPEEDGFSVLVPAIPEICTQGNTEEEALENAREAIECYLESCSQQGELPELERVGNYQIKDLTVCLA